MNVPGWVKGVADRVGRPKPYDGTRFHRPEHLYPFRAVPAVRDGRITSLQAFIDGFQHHLQRIPELRTLAEVAQAHDAQAVLSGGTALRLLLSYMDALEKEPQGSSREPLPMARLLEGQDVDGLLLGNHRILSEAEVAEVAAELNRKSGADLVAPLPSMERRYYAIEWDLQEGSGFFALNQTFGGESLAHMGFGLDADGRILIYDPDRALPQAFAGYFNHVAPSPDAASHPMVTSGKMDVALEGLRIIRMVGITDDYGIKPSEQALGRLFGYGENSLARFPEVAKAYVESPEGKLPRRWHKYLEKIWVDFKDPTLALDLLTRSGYADLLLYLGLRRDLVYLLPKFSPPPALAPSAAVQVAAETAWTALGDNWAAPKDDYYLWTHSRWAGELVEGERPYGKKAGKLGAGLYLTDRSFPESGTASDLLKVSLQPSARLLDLNQPRVREVVDAYLAAATPHFVERFTAPAQLEREFDGRSLAMSFLLASLGADGAVEGTGIDVSAVVTHHSALASFQPVYDFKAGLLRQLEEGELGAQTEHGVRGLLALKGQEGLVELERLLSEQRVSLAQLFPEGQAESLFLQLPFTAPTFAASLERLAEGQALSESQRQAVARAVAYLRGDLPDDGSQPAA